MISIQSKWLLPLSFFIFISYIIFLADTADYNFAFRVVGHIPYGDKIAHALLYGVMALLLNYGLDFRRVGFPTHHTIYISKWVRKPTLQLGSILILIFATLEECSQYYIPSRTFDLGDLLADFVGVVLFSVLRNR